MSQKGFVKVWTDVGTLVANGGRINRSDLLAIYSILKLDLFDPKYLPTEDTVDGSAGERRDKIFELAESIWGLRHGDWLKMEKAWLDESRKISGSTETKGKERIDDVVSAEILIRLIAAARYVSETNDTYKEIDEAIEAINIILAIVCSKGRTRMMRRNGKSVYGDMKRYGLMIGTGAGKYLPYPAKALPELLLLMLDKKHINPNVYRLDLEEVHELLST